MFCFFRQLLWSYSLNTLVSQLLIDQLVAYSIFINQIIYFLQKLFQVKARSQPMMTPTSMLNKLTKVYESCLSLYKYSHYGNTF